MKAVWIGAIRFGLILIPVRMYKASKEKSLELVQLRRSDQARIRNRRVSETTGEEVPYEAVTRGYEYEPGKFVTLEPEDFVRASIRKTQQITLISFVDDREIDPRYMEKPFYLEPTEHGAKPYALLREAMRQSGKVAVARFVMKTREHLAMLKPEGDAILLEQLRFAGDLRDPEGLELPEKKTVSEREVRMAVKLIDLLTQPWKPKHLRDTYTEDLQRFILEKVEGKEHPLESDEGWAEYNDLFTALNESLSLARRARKTEKQS